MLQLEQELRRFFGFSAFRPGQKEIIADVLNGHDVLAVLPTGTGKSVCYQLPGVLMKKPVLIVSPLLSLMEDQTEQLKRMGFKRSVAFNSFLSMEEKKEEIQKLPDSQFIFVSPEMLQSRQLVEMLKQVNIGLFAVDEAHCISQWGHEFRPHYLGLAEIRKELGNPPCLALTATAGKKVREDIIKYLGLARVKLHIGSMNRKNIALVTEYASSQEEKQKRLQNLVTSLKGPGIVYTSTRNMAEAACLLAKDAGVARTAFYHGGMEHQDRMLIQKQFLLGQLDLICCTNAFGMGINKSDVRYVIHYQLPSSIEAYVQEIGRAGRDGEPALAVLLYHPQDEDIPYHFIEAELPDASLLPVLLGGDGTKQSMLERVHQGMFTENAARFLEYYINREPLLMMDTQNKKIFLDKLSRKIVKRKKDKHEQLRKLLTWVRREDCKRASLIKLFDESGDPQHHDCCSSCQISLTAYYGRANTVNATVGDWREELKTMFSIERGSGSESKKRAALNS
ncbi:RecQ family ATP-dependent DNA helicase [Fictibacillus iocasae]|uniref:RecQ family ATP-dependent DNA helicase n=1 Tax=Fictibacillus iocasae TaxID=2715437 RepID=A0ABW2NPY8_9BACL